MNNDFHSTTGVHCFVAHVRQGYEDRETHITRMLRRMGIPFEFMTRGDIPDLTPELRSRLLSPDIGIPLPAQSCAVKHLLICEEIVSRNLPGALVLEDDIVLAPRFNEVFAQSMRELPACESTPGAPCGVLISYEDTRLRFVERSRRQKGRVLYPGDRDRMAGCYYINREAAAAILDGVRADGGLPQPIDHYHATLMRRGVIQYLWCQPTVATQGSHNGLFRSSLNTRKARIEELKWRLRLHYRKLLYFLR